MNMKQNKRNSSLTSRQVQIISANNKFKSTLNEDIIPFTQNLGPGSPVSSFSKQKYDIPIKQIISPLSVVAAPGNKFTKSKIKNKRKQKFTFNMK